MIAAEFKSCICRGYSARKIGFCFQVLAAKKKRLHIHFLLLQQLFHGLLSVLYFFKYLCLKLFKIVFMKNLYNIVLGVGGVGSIEVIKNVDIPTTAETKDIVSIIIQLAIGVVTLLGLLKKKTPKN